LRRNKKKEEPVDGQESYRSPFMNSAEKNSFREGRGHKKSHQKTLAKAGGRKFRLLMGTGIKQRGRRQLHGGLEGKMIRHSLKGKLGEGEVATKV